MTNFQEMNKRICQDDCYCCAPMCNCPMNEDKMKYSIRELRDIEISLYSSSSSLKEILDICEQNNVTNFENVQIHADITYDYDNAYSEIVLKIKNQPVP